MRKSSEYEKRVRTRVSVFSEGGEVAHEMDRRVEARTGEVEDMLGRCQAIHVVRVGQRDRRGPRTRVQ